MCDEEADVTYARCTGFEGSAGALNLFDLADESEAGCMAGAPGLTAYDESTKVPGVFLVGPQVVQDGQSFCFVYKFRQRRRRLTALPRRASRGRS